MEAQESIILKEYLPFVGQDDMPHVPAEERLFALQEAFRVGLIKAGMLVSNALFLADEYYRQLNIHSAAGDD